MFDLCVMLLVLLFECIDGVCVFEFVIVSVIDDVFVDVVFDVGGGGMMEEKVVCYDGMIGVCVVGYGLCVGLFGGGSGFIKDVL